MDQNPSLHRDSDKDRSGYTSGGWFFKGQRMSSPSSDLVPVVRADRLPQFKLPKKNRRLATPSGLGDDPKRSPWFFVSPLNQVRPENAHPASQDRSSLSSHPQGQNGRKGKGISRSPKWAKLRLRTILNIAHIFGHQQRKHPSNIHRGLMNGSLWFLNLLIEVILLVGVLYDELLQDHPILISSWFNLQVDMVFAMGECNQ